MTGSFWTNYRTVVEEKTATESVDDLKRKYERFADQWDGFVWLVSRTPEDIGKSKEVNGVTYYVAHRAGDMSIGLVDFAVVYTVSHGEVNIIDVQAWDDFDE